MTQEKPEKQMQSCFNKKEILAEIQKKIDERYELLKISMDPAAHSMTKIRIFEELLAKVDKMLFLPLKSNDFWSYVVYADEYGAKVELICGYYTDTKIRLQRTVFAEVKARMLDSETYGLIHGIGAGTVRQWIRRGKLPNAMKVGSVWLISELALPKGRGYDFRVYVWDRAECYFEEDLAWLNNYDGVSLEQRQPDEFVIIPRTKHECGELVDVFPQSQQPELEGIVMDQKRKESFELKLIENPFVKHRTFALNFRKNK